MRHRRLKRSRRVAFNSRSRAAILAAGVVGVVCSLSLACPAPTPTPPPPGDPPPAFNQLIDDELKRAWESLDEGQIAYEPERKMTQGVAEEIRVRISGDASVAIDESVFSEEVVVERLKTSGSMSADLSAKEDEFEIERLSSRRQALVGEYTDWIWRVTPLRAGDLELFLRVTAQIRLSNGDKESRDVLVKETIISVAANRSWAAGRFFTGNWQWILGGPLTLAVLGWLIAWLKGRRTKHPRDGNGPG